MIMAQYVDLAHLRRLLAQGYSQRAMAKELGISRTALQRFLLSLKRPAQDPLTPVLRQILSRLETLETALHRGQATGRSLPPGPRATGDISVRWSVRVPRPLAQYIQTLAAERKLPTSRLVQDALQQWLAGQ
jgi:transcriptional regulator with XRE-family HTH domain